MSNKGAGRVVTWKFKVWYFSKENIAGCLDYPSCNYQVCVLGPLIDKNDPSLGEFTYQAAELIKVVPTVHEKDLIEVTGEFKTISSDNFVVLRAIHVTNLGYQE